jgi:hypothetical protein
MKQARSALSARAEQHVANDQLNGADAVGVLPDQTYDFILGTRRFGEHLAFCTQLASKIAVHRLRRSPLLGTGQELGSLSCRHLENKSA